MAGVFPAGKQCHTARDSARKTCHTVPGLAFAYGAAEGYNQRSPDLGEPRSVWATKWIAIRSCESST